MTQMTRIYDRKNQWNCQEKYEGGKVKYVQQLASFS